MLQAVLLVLIQDLKDEGNQLFKEGQFAKACSHYTHGIFVARVLEDRFYHEVGTEFMGTLYSNGSLSHLKLVSCFVSMFVCQHVCFERVGSNLLI